MKNKKRIVIVGATSSIAHHCTKLWLQKYTVDMVLLGRDEHRLERVAADLRARDPLSTFQVVKADFSDARSIQRIVDEIAFLGVVDIVLIAHGSLSQQDVCQRDLAICQQELEINGVSPVLYAEAFAQQMEKLNHGTIAVIGSVAGDRGRKSNYVYGAAKGLVTRYAQGLQHRFANSNVKIVLLKPGPTDTPMTAHLKDQGMKLASVELVAQGIIQAIERGASVAYVPGKWYLIMMIIRHLPGYIFNKLNI